MGTTKVPSVNCVDREFHGDRSENGRRTVTDCAVTSAALTVRIAAALTVVPPALPTATVKRALLSAIWVANIAHVDVVAPSIGVPDFGDVVSPVPAVAVPVPEPVVVPLALPVVGVPVPIVVVPVPEPGVVPVPEAVVAMPVPAPAVPVPLDATATATAGAELPPPRRRRMQRA